jgi:hypothetical protein
MDQAQELSAKGGDGVCVCVTAIAALAARW